MKSNIQPAMNVPVQSSAHRPIALSMDDIYALSAIGRDELLGSATTRSPAELEFLIRVDGSHSLRLISDSMQGVLAESFEPICRRMIESGFVVAVHADPVALQMQASLNQLAPGTGDSGADAGLSSLRNSGFFVEIARSRLPGRVRKPGEVLSAVVVEDEPTLAKFIRSYLTFEGFNVRLASNRSEIVAEFNKPPIPDVILLDVLLPDADGFEILLRVRQHKTLCKVPVIMLTGKATRESVLKGMAGGADGYVTKPFEADALMRAVRTVVGLPEDGPREEVRDPWSNRDSNRWKS